jgi:choline dehydrogenase-like flavoprotein
LIEDLTGTGDRTTRTDVAVIGAGTAGLVIAAALERRGLSVLCLESGGRKQVSDEHPLNEVVHTKSIYSGAAHGRFRCIGGTSTRWGGALIPCLARDVEDAGWPISYDEIIIYQKAVEKLFGLSDGPYEFQDIVGSNDAAYVARMAKWPPFGHRNVFNLLEPALRAAHGPTIVLNATATDFLISGCRLQCVTAHAPDGSRITAQARHVVLAAGAIETTRLLLLLSRQNPGVLREAQDLLGRNFHDHLSVKIGILDPIDRHSCNRLFGFRFEPNGTMRKLSFELSESTLLREFVPRCYAHVAFAEEQDNGFFALRELFRYAQQRRLPPSSTITKLASAAPWLLRAARCRWFEGRLLYADEAELQVHMVIEQIPRLDNRISLASGKVDMFGQPLAQIEWSVDSEDVDNVVRATDAFRTMWNSSRLALVARFAQHPQVEIESALAAESGIYHPGGSTRMGSSAASGVVDRDLRVFGLGNVSVVSTSIFPTGGGATPTMMLLMLALRLVDQLSDELRQ